MFGQRLLYLADLPIGKAIVFAKLHRSCRTIQIKDCLTAPADYMDVSGSVIVRVDYDAQSIKPENCRHSLIIS